MSEFLDIAYAASKALKRGETAWLAITVRGRELETLLIKEAAVAEERAI